MQTGENEQGLRKVLDLTRFISMSILFLHFYYTCYGAFKQWKFTAAITDNLLNNIANTGLFRDFNRAKLIALGFLIISLVGAKGKKDDKVSYKNVFAYLLTGLLVYFISFLIFYMKTSITTIAACYIALCSTGFVLILTGGTLLSRIIRLKMTKDVFNELNESFPQEERLLENEYSVNLPTRYKLKGKERKGWINLINPFRGNLVIGTPGAGKSYFVIRHVITQHIQKGFTMFLYDFKFDDLSKIAYNTLLKYRNAYPVVPKFYVINFDDLTRTHRCNPLDPKAMSDITDATESARTIMLGLNREWIRKQGDFFVESSINFVTAIIWFLKKYQNGKYCTLPHVIELMQVEYEKLFAVLGTEPEIEVFINPFVSALKNEVMEQLEGQIASAKITMARLASPQLYYVLSENEFTLDVNSHTEPKIVCMGSNPQKQQVYGAVLSLYISRVIKLVNQKNRQKCSLIFDEFPTIYFNGIDNLMATARSNKVATTLGVQDYSQLRKDYGREQAEVIMNIAGNIVSGQVTGDTAKQLSERFGKIVQERESISINAMDTSVSRSSQLDSAVPASKIAALSSGEFVGMVTDNPEQKIALKTFYCEIINDHDSIKNEESSFIAIPVIRNIQYDEVEESYLGIKKNIRDIIEREIEVLTNTPPA